MRQVFWLVWGSGVPYFRHNTLASACREAERLARLDPAHEFIVVRAVAAVKKSDISWESFDDDHHAQIPF